MAGKSEISDYVTNNVEGVTKKQAGEMVDAVVDFVTNSLCDGEKVTIPGFGTFLVSDSAERQGRNPKTGEAMTIAARTNARFKAGKGLKDAVNG
jgi:DNA-binding protein HU-beta